MTAQIIEATDDMFLAAVHRLLTAGDITRDQYDTILKRAAIAKVKQ